MKTAEKRERKSIFSLGKKKVKKKRLLLLLLVLGVILLHFDPVFLLHFDPVFNRAEGFHGLSPVVLCFFVHVRPLFVEKLDHRRDDFVFAGSCFHIHEEPGLVENGVWDDMYVVNAFFFFLRNINLTF